MRYFAVLLAMAGFLTSCHRTPLDCRTEYLTPAYLASEQANTPDPLRDCFYGQQLIVHWYLPDAGPDPVDLHVRVRHGNRAIETFVIPVTKVSGSWIYQLINEDYWCVGGILSYQARLFQSGELVDEWNHHLWTDLIEVKES